MAIFLGFLVLLAVGVEVYALLNGLKHVRFDYEPQVLQSEPGEEIPVHLQVSNVGIMPITNLRVEVSFPPCTQFEAGMPVTENRLKKTVTVRFRLWGRQRITKTVPIRIEKRGTHFLKGASLYRGDFLGLLQVPGDHVVNQELLIYPKRMENDKLLDALGSYCGDIIAQRHLIRDPILTMGVREYTGREAMKTISWTQTARRGQLMTREFDYTRDYSCVVLLATDELNPIDVHLLDRGCSIVRTVCQELADKGINVDFYTNGARWSWKRDTRRIWNCTAGPGRQGELLECMARLYPSVRCPAEEMAATAARSSGFGMAYVLVATQRSEHVERAMEILQEKSGMKTLLLLAEDYEEA